MQTCGSAFLFCAPKTDKFFHFGYNDLISNEHFSAYCPNCAKTLMHLSEQRKNKFFVFF